MINLIRNFLLISRLEFIREKIIKKLYESEGQITEESLISHVTGFKGSDLLLIRLIILNAVDMIKNGGDALNGQQLKFKLKEEKRNQELFKLDTIKEQTKWKLRELADYFYIGRQATIADPHSFTAIKYSLEMDKMQPISKRDIEALKKVSGKSHLFD